MVHCTLKNTLAIAQTFYHCVGSVEKPVSVDLNDKAVCR